MSYRLIAAPYHKLTLSPTTRPLAVGKAAISKFSPDGKNALQAPLHYSCAKQILTLRICNKPTGRGTLHIMGKRKKAAKKPVGPKKNAPLPSNFDCLFCNHVNSVSVKLDKKAGVGALACKVCSQHFQCSINYLSAAVDVYSDWVDACDAVAKDDGDAADYGHGSEARVPAVGRPRGRGREEEEEDGDGLIDDADASDDGRGAYGGEGVVADDDEY